MAAVAPVASPGSSVASYLDAAGGTTLADTVPQLIDPSLDGMAYLLIKRVRQCPSTGMATGIRGTKRAIFARIKPSIIVACTDAYGYVNDHLDDMRATAASRGIPVVYALSRKLLGEACGLRKPISAVALGEMADEDSRMLLGIVMARAAEACSGFLRALAGRSPSPQRHQPTFQELAHQPYLVPASIANSFGALQLV